jgi:hypothetical protein
MSGLRTASTRASCPPRLCPISTTSRPVRAASRSRRTSIALAVRSPQSALIHMPAAAARDPRLCSQPLSRLSDWSEAMNPGTSSTGGELRLRFGAKKTGSAASRANSSP